MMEPGGTDADSEQPGHEPFRPELHAVEWEADEQADSTDVDARLFTLASRLVETGKQHAFLSPYIPTSVLTTALQGYLDLQDDEVLLAVVGIPKHGGTRLGCADFEAYLLARSRRRETQSGPPRCQSLEYGMLPPATAVGQQCDQSWGRAVVWHHRLERFAHRTDRLPRRSTLSGSRRRGNTRSRRAGLATRSLSLAPPRPRHRGCTVAPVGYPAIRRPDDACVAGNRDACLCPGVRSGRSRDACRRRVMEQSHGGADARMGSRFRRGRDHQS